MLIEFEMFDGRPLVAKLKGISAIFPDPHERKDILVRVDGDDFQVKGTLAEVRKKWEEAMGEGPKRNRVICANCLFHFLGDDGDHLCDEVSRGGIDYITGEAQPDIHIGTRCFYKNCEGECQDFRATPPQEQKHPEPTQNKQGSPPKKEK